MFDFKLLFSNGTEYVVQNVIKVIYPHRGENHVVRKDRFLSERIPTCDLSLYTNDNCVSISGEDLLLIEITQHTD